MSLQYHNFYSHNMDLYKLKYIATFRLSYFVVRLLVLWLTPVFSSRRSRKCYSAKNTGKLHWFPLGLDESNHSTWDECIPPGQCIIETDWKIYRIWLKVLFSEYRLILSMSTWWITGQNTDSSLLLRSRRGGKQTHSDLWCS